MYSKGLDGHRPSQASVERVVCFSPDLGSTMNQVSCFFPEKENAF